jgi:hypothetical protein
MSTSSWSVTVRAPQGRLNDPGRRVGMPRSSSASAPPAVGSPRVCGWREKGRRGVRTRRGVGRADVDASARRPCGPTERIDGERGRLLRRGVGRAPPDPRPATQHEPDAVRRRRRRASTVACAPMAAGCSAPAAPRRRSRHATDRRAPLTSGSPRGDEPDPEVGAGRRRTHAHRRGRGRPPAGVRSTTRTTRRVRPPRPHRRAEHPRHGPHPLATPPGSIRASASPAPAPRRGGPASPRRDEAPSTSTVVTVVNGEASSSQAATPAPARADDEHPPEAARWRTGSGTAPTTPSASGGAGDAGSGGQPGSGAGTGPRGERPRRRPRHPRLSPTGARSACSLTQPCQQGCPQRGDVAGADGEDDVPRGAARIRDPADRGLRSGSKTPGPAAAGTARATSSPVTPGSGSSRARRRRGRRPRRRAERRTNSAGEDARPAVQMRLEDHRAPARRRSRRGRRAAAPRPSSGGARSRRRRGTPGRHALGLEPPPGTPEGRETLGEAGGVEAEPDAGRSSRGRVEGVVRARHAQLQAHGLAP